MNSIFTILCIILLSGVFSNYLSLLACPLQLYADRELVAFKGQAIKNLSIFTKSSRGSIVQLPYQVDTDGIREATPEALVENTRLTLDVSEFGQKLSTPLKQLPCRPSKIFEIKDIETNKYSYLTQCDRMQDKEWNLKTGFKHIKSEHRFETEGLKFVYKPWNLYLFESASLYDFEKKIWHEVSRDASFNLHLNIKRFININFDDSQVRSELVFEKYDDLSLSTRLKFFLNILFFKINLSADSYASFYKKGVHLPLVFNVPMDANTRLHHGSGFLFTWKNTGMEFLNLEENQGLPIWNADLHHKSFATMQKKSLEFCDNYTCRFRIQSKLKSGQRVSLIMQQSRELTEQGFFPIWINNPVEFNQQMALGLKKDRLQDKVGIYQEASHLKKGMQRVDIWIHEESPTPHGYRACPPPVQITQYK